MCRLRDRLLKNPKDLKVIEEFEEFKVEFKASKAKAEERRKKQEAKCWNCDGEFSPHHQCYSEL